MSEKRLGFTRMVRNACENRHDHVAMHGELKRAAIFLFCQPEMCPYALHALCRR